MASAFTVRVDESVFGLLIEIEFRLTLSPGDGLETLSVIEELKPPDVEVAIVLVEVPPCCTVIADGEAVRVKSPFKAGGLNAMSNTGCNSISLGATPCR